MTTTTLPTDGLSAGITVCQLCSGECKTCAKEATSCLTCSIGFYYNSGKCVVTCPVSFYEDKTTFSCKACDSSCLLCYDSTNLSCKVCA